MKIRLHQTFGAHAGRSRELDQDVITFGRLPSCDFAFDAHADLDASGSHAELRREGQGWVLRDVGSRNGTLVAGRPVQRHEISDGDEIEFGTGGPRVRVELVASAPAAKPMGTMAATPILGAPPAQPTPPPAFAPTATPAGEPKKYGQATLDAAVEAAANKARAEALAGVGAMPKGTALLPQSQLPQPGMPGAAPAYLAPTSPPMPPTVAPAPAPTASSSTLWLIASIVALFVFLVLCLVSCVLLGYWFQYG
ncbi:MAG: FHA domain-containing protein [Sandaracinus sp.]